jgi:hypothetical protein
VNGGSDPALEQLQQARDAGLLEEETYRQLGVDMAPNTSSGALYTPTR